jgi:hypothetical protein
MKTETKIGLKKDAYKALIGTAVFMVFRGISSLSSIDGSVDIADVLIAGIMVFALMLGVLTLYRRLTKRKS